MRKSYRSGRASLLSFALIPLAAAAALVAAPALAAGQSGDGLTPQMRFALQRDLGIMPGQVPQYLRAEKLAVRKQYEAQAALGDSFAGTWLERNRLGDFELVVATTRQASVATARAYGQQTRLVAHTLKQLDDSLTRLNDAGRANTRSVGTAGAGKPDARIQSWGIDLRSNKLVVKIDPGAEKLAADFVARSGADPSTIEYKISTARPQPTVDVRGGDRYNLPNGGWCSVGLSVYAGGTSGFATAGHCGTVNTQVSTGNPNYAFGAFAGSQFPGADQAWVRNDYAYYWVNPALVNLYNGSNLAVIGNLETPIGGANCRSGAKTGWQCGTVTQRNVTINYAAGPTYGMMLSTACSGFGDSGGSVISPWGEAQGVHSGSYIPQGREDNCGTGLESIHQPIQPLLNSYGLVLNTVQTCGRMNPGRVLGTNASVTSCDGRFTFVIQGDGNLVLYQNGVGAIWANYIFGNGHVLAMQTDGNLVVYNNAGRAVWNTGTWGRNGALLLVQNDGNVVVYSHQGQPLWWTGTCCR